MTDDPIVAEVRRVREEHAAGLDHDLDRIFDDLKRSEAERDNSKSPLVEIHSGHIGKPACSLQRVRFSRPSET